ncbi:AAA domain-containing protein [Actinoplanes sp. NPDC051861]|uniref:AAA domain-containing protein n=1 Tax=Actinoplanes sp. NPDC051861 TaxID=3155170 RepID=UPI003444224F
MASTSVDLGHDEGRDGRDEGPADFCASLEAAVARNAAGLDARIQRDAIVRLRASPGLLALLSEGRWAEPGERSASTDVIQRALRVPDMFCLIAQPGVNRAQTVLEIVRSAAKRGERILITAPTAAALDTVVSRLPHGPTVIRTDRDGHLATVAARLQRRILERSESSSKNLGAWLGEPSPAKGRLRRLNLTLDEARRARKQCVTVRTPFTELAAQRALESAERSAHQLARMLTGVVPVPHWTADLRGLEAFAGHCGDLEPTLRARAGLIREWRQRAARPSRQLHAELLRYADIVVTTCLGAGRPEHADLDFDLLVVEDAGRVTTAEALVPLVRARRAVLAGTAARGSVLDHVLAHAPEANRAHLP